MGIDFLDIIYRVEKSLGIRLEREDFDFSQGKFLVGDFYDLVERKVRAASKEIPESPDYREKIARELSQTLSEQFDIDDNWTPTTTVRQIYNQIPECRRKKSWRNFKTSSLSSMAKEANIVITSKSRGNLRLAWGGYVFFVCIFSFVLGQFFFQAGLLTFFILLLPGSILWLIIWNKYNDWQNSTFVPDVTLDEIAEKIIFHRKRSLKEDGSYYSRAEIEAIVKEALCEALAVKPEDVTPEKDIIRDLGAE